jgi:hypothetical protein
LRRGNGGDCFSGRRNGGPVRPLRRLRLFRHYRASG